MIQEDYAEEVLRLRENKRLLNKTIEKKDKEIKKISYTVAERDEEI
jgi:hypothetical protein